MGNIRTKKLKDGTVHYHAEIHINKKGFPSYREAKTFANKKVAQNWITTRETELKDDLKQLFGAKGIDKNMTIGQAIDRYISELDTEFGRSKMHARISVRQKYSLESGKFATLSNQADMFTTNTFQ